jgi:cbb3-type cytochrome oxidase cytochrome c subunit
VTPTTLSRFSRENAKIGKPANNDVQTWNRPRRNGSMRTSSDNHKAINDYLDSFHGSFLVNEKTRDAAARMISYSKAINAAKRELNECIASLQDGNR